MRGLWLLVLTLLVWSTGAAAQQQPPSGEAEAPPAETAEGAEQPAVEGSDAAAAQGADAPAAAPAPDPDAPDPDVLAEAITHFKQGRAFADSGDCRGAVVEFQAAFDLIPRPSALYNIAQCQERLFRYDLAIEFYNEFLAKSGPDEPDRQAVLTAIAVLERLLATITVKSSVPAEVWVGDRLAGQAPGEILVPGGTYTIELRAAGYESERREISVIGQQKLSMEFSLRELSTYEGLSPIYFYGAATVALALGAVGGVFGLKAMKASDDAGKVEPERNTQDTIDDIGDKQNLADIFFASAGVVAVGATILYFMTDWGDEQVGDQPPDGLGVQAVITPDGAGLVWRGSL